jgi:hypothetical protein
MSSVVNNKITNAFASSGGESSSYSSLSSIQSLPPAIITQVQNAFSDAIRWAYIAILPFACIAAFSVFFLREVKIERSAEEIERREREKNRQDAELGHTTQNGEDINENGNVTRPRRPRVKIIGPIGVVIWCCQALGDKMGWRK